MVKSMLTPTQKKKIRESLRSYGLGAIANEIRIHYTQARRFYYYDDLRTVKYANLDCSGLVGNAFWNAMHDTGIFIHDPLDCRYTGEGYTGTLEDYLRRHGKRITTQGFLIGDIVRWGYGVHAHTAYCIKAGSASTADWASHGREAGPQSVKLHYRDDLVGVWRLPELL